MSEQAEQAGLPPGWDCKYDARTGRYYYVNLFTKTTQWEDPRARIRQLQTGAPLHISNDSIAMQPMHGSPYHVYPASNSFYPAQAAFQNPPSGVPSLTASPNFAQRLHQQQLQNHHIEMTPMVRSSPRMGLGRQGMLETTFTTNVTAAETDLTVAKINSMFPTVPETHIRMLLKKYYNREAVVISALQVEKHPLTTPGPYSTPPLGHRPFHNTAMGVVSAFQMTPLLGGRSDLSSSRTGSPVPRPASGASGSYGYGSPRNCPSAEGYRSSPKPHSSPKMKLRYMKSIFPKAEETLILDVLANADNNVQSASQQLLKMGYDKREQPVPQRSSSRKGTGTSQTADDERKEEPKTPTPKLRSPEEKKKIKARLQTKYKDTPEKIILMALESVDYSEDRAKKILNIVIQEDREKKKSVKIETPRKTLDEDKENARTAGSGAPRYSIFRSSSSEDESAELAQGSPMADSKTGPHQTARTAPKGPNTKLFKGPNDDLLLADYVTWNGANPDLAKGTQCKVGSGGMADRSVRAERTYKAHGPNGELCKGPVGSLAKGSMYAPMVNDVKCN
ncbi:muscle M-line assembly protein unc-89 isoform X5 [Anopheles bellator]|uniref:muscle M-line assembly protein unc-89 isoform X5 n=1 Tax=Anopheles bellator TaxID=139047 RepID=UPI0026483BD5|nr:muscle M-line assembly protein unc-89 isoform X5 [Anopheles bellator]